MPERQEDTLTLILTPLLTLTLLTHSNTHWFTLTFTLAVTQKKHGHQSMRISFQEGCPGETSVAYNSCDYINQYNCI